MRVWHDDIRQPPGDWFWVRTNETAQKVLSAFADEIVEISLDHDLGLDYIDPEIYEHNPLEIWTLRGDSPRGDGRDLVRWMIENNVVPPKVTIHSWNPSGAMEMAHLLYDAGHGVVIQPFDPKKSWL